MNDVSDLELMAFADGQISSSDAERVRQALAGDAALRKRLEAFIATRGPVATAFEGMLHEPPPAKLVDFVLNGPSLRVVEGGSAGPVASMSTLSMTASVGNGNGPRKGNWAGVAVRLAASIALFASGAAAAWFTIHQTRPGSGTMPEGAGAALATISHLMQSSLETAPSRSTAKAALGNSGQATMRVTSTFIARDRRFCREFTLTTGEADHFGGVACRSANGWLIEHQARSVISTPPRAGIVTARGSAKNSLDQAVEGLIDGGVLDQAEEERLLRSNWNSASAPH